MSELLQDDQRWSVHHGDTIEHMATLPEHCFDLAITSVPFISLYAYTDSHNDIGNSEDFKGSAKLHLSYFYHQVARVVKPGRVIVVHVMQIPRMKRNGEVGLNDFRGLNIRLGERAGLVYEYDWSVRKGPQSQALRTRSRELQFAGLESDRAKSRGALNDYLIKFRVPGDNEVPIVSECQVSRNDWIRWAEGTWDDIRESDTLNTKEAKSEEDTRHICPLQLPVIDRLVKLFSNPGEIVFDPFMGIGSTGYVAIKNDRRTYGCELKDEYHEAAVRNITKAESIDDDQMSLFSEVV